MSSVDLPPDLMSAGRARQFVADCADRLGRPQVAELAQLLVSELVTNAVSHAGTGVRVECRLTDEGLRVAVEDGSEAPPTVRHPGTWQEDGRGLLLVESLAARWGTDPGAGPGKQVWFELADEPTAGQSCR